MKITEERINHYMDSYGMSYDMAKSVLDKNEDFNKKLVDQGNEILTRLKGEIASRKRLTASEKILNKDK